MAAKPSFVTIKVSLPRPLKRCVDGKVSSGIYSSADEFVREVIRERYERERKKVKRALAAKLRTRSDVESSTTSVRVKPSATWSADRNPLVA